jgi:hypothetical protein
MPLVGLKNVTIAKITKDDSTGTTYEAVRKIALAVQADIKPSTVNGKLLCR